MTAAYRTEAPTGTDLCSRARGVCASAVWEWLDQQGLADLSGYDFNGVAVFAFDLARLEKDAGEIQWEFCKSEDGLEVWDTSLGADQIDETPRVKLVLSLGSVLQGWVKPVALPPAIQ